MTGSYLLVFLVSFFLGCSVGVLFMSLIASRRVTDATSRAVVLKAEADFWKEGAKTLKADIENGSNLCAIREFRRKKGLTVCRNEVAEKPVDGCPMPSNRPREGKP